MPLFSLRSTKSSPTNSHSSLTEDKFHEPTPKSSKTSPMRSKKQVEEDLTHIEPTPLHPILQSPRKNVRASSMKALTPHHSPSQPLLKLSSSFSPTNRYISNINQYSRKRSTSMDSTELAKTLNIYNSMKERQIEEEKRKQLLSSELDSSITIQSPLSLTKADHKDGVICVCSHSVSSNNSSSCLLSSDIRQSSNFYQASDEEILYSPPPIITTCLITVEESPTNQKSNINTCCSSADNNTIEGNKIPFRKEFKKLPHLRKRVARNSLKTQLEMNKEKEALELEKEAKKFSSRSLTRWKPDYDSAGAAYEKAGAIFKALKQQGKAISCYTNSGECFYKCGVYYKSGQGFENAANLCRDTKDFSMAVELYTRASTSYLDDGKGNRAGEALTKAAKMLVENGNIPQAIEMYRSAVESLAMGGAYHNAMTTYRAYNDFLIRNSQWEEAISNSLEMIVGYKALSQHDNVNKTCTSIVLICLKMDDFVRAEEYHKKFQSEHNSYGTSKESDISEDFLDAFERMDNNSLETVKQNHHLKYLEASVYKMVSKLSLSGGIGESSTQIKKPRQPKPMDGKKASLLGHEEESEDEVSDPCQDDPLIPADKDDAFDPNDLT